MLLPDVNVLLYAHRSDARDHARFRAWLEGAMEGEEQVGIADIVLSGFIRVVTNPRAFAHPTPLDRALKTAGALRSHPNAVPVAPGPRHWEVFRRLCLGSGARGNIVPDAYLAALAIEWGAEWITADRDFSRFPGLRWRNPLEEPEAR